MKAYRSVQESCHTQPDAKDGAFTLASPGRWMEVPTASKLPRRTLAVGYS